MKSYIVGGAVRDRLLGLPVQDRDHVVVGASPEQMLAQGFLPVGRDFPVFLHPQTKEEYALARTERKSGRGYQGFVFHAAEDVTLEQDLARRDLTINAIAEDEDGTLIDPYGGQRDLRDRVFRHAGPAFAEDPVRILRVARFAARFADFSIAHETRDLMRQMVESGEVDSLVPERVWQELARGLMEQRPSRMLEVLHDCGALAHIAPELHGLWNPTSPHAQEAPKTLGALDRAAHCGLSLTQRFAIMVAGVASVRDSAAGLIVTLFQRLRPPGDCRDLAHMLAREAAWLSGAVSEHYAGTVPKMVSEQALALFERCDALRRPQRFEQMLQAWVLVAEYQVRADRVQVQVQVARLRRALEAARDVDAGAIVQALVQGVANEIAPEEHSKEHVKEHLAGPDEKRAAAERIPTAVRSARTQAIATSLDASDGL